MNDRKTVLVTGGAGFIGSHVVDELIMNNFKVLVVDNYVSSEINYNNPQCTYYDMNILSENLKEIFAMNKIDFCVHLAAQISVKKSIDDPYYDAETNICGTIKLLNLCKEFGVSKFFAASSAAVYGNPEYLPIDEKHSCNPISPYGISKLTMEKYIINSGLDYTIFRFANVYGERQSVDGEAGVVAIFNNAIINNEPLYIDGDGEQTRDFIYVKDIAKIISIALLEFKDNEIVNISTNQPCSVSRLAETMIKIAGSKSTIYYRQPRLGDIKHSILDNSKLLHIINGFTNTKLEGGLECLIAEEKNYD